MSDKFNEFDECIIRELTEAGLTGKDLVRAFNEKKKQIKPAVKSMLKNAHSAAQGNGEYATYEDIFETLLIECAEERMKNYDPKSVIAADKLYNELDITEDVLKAAQDVEIE